jgi:predicted dehydrogenase
MGDEYMKRLKVGVIGLGLGKLHVASYSARETVGRLVICDSNPEILEIVQDSFPKIKKAYTDLDAMLEREDLDIVSVTTPDHLHRPHAVKCLKAGCHVLLTKPMALTLADAKAIVRAAETSGRKLMVAQERRFRTFTLKLKELLDRGFLGDIVHVRYDSIQDKREQFRRAPWYASPEVCRTPITGSGIHQVDMIRFLIGLPVIRVGAFSNAFGDLEFPGNKTTTALFQFQGRIIGQVTVTYVVHLPPKAEPIDDTFRLVGTKGIVVGNRVAYDGINGWKEIPRDRVPIPKSSDRCIESFLRSVLENRPVAIEPRDAFASVAAAVAADESAATGDFIVPVGQDF